MLLTNHSLTGVLLGLTIDNPLILAPAAVASHLVLDSTPHFGLPEIKPDPEPGAGFRTPLLFVIGSVDFALSLTVLVVSLWVFSNRRGHVALGWLGAVAPDLLYLPEIFFKQRVSGKFGDFHHWLQWGESKAGLVTEMIWSVGMVSLIVLH